jgi:hypothetical protein
MEENMKKIIMSVMVACLLLSSLLICQSPKKAESPAGSDSLKLTPANTHNQLILWTSGDREVALKMMFMYTYYCKKNLWMDTVRLMVWGPSSKLLAEDTVLQGKLNDLKQVGVELYACKACADMYGISDKLKDLGITVMYTGKMLVELQKNGWHILTI